MRRVLNGDALVLAMWTLAVSIWIVIAARDSSRAHWGAAIGDAIIATLFATYPVLSAVMRRYRASDAQR